jgi:hypothetical protein
MKCRRGKNGCSSRSTRPLVSDRNPTQAHLKRAVTALSRVCRNPAIAPIRSRMRVARNLSRSVVGVSARLR